MCRPIRHGDAYGRLEKEGLDLEKRISILRTVIENAFYLYVYLIILTESPKKELPIKCKLRTLMVVGGKSQLKY